VTTKQHAQYTEIAFLQVGQSAWVYMLTHPRLRGVGPVKTSMVLKVSDDGKAFETLNTIWGPVSDPDVEAHKSELDELLDTF
jgi:hypothetical protein